MVQRHARRRGVVHQRRIGAHRALTATEFQLKVVLPGHAAGGHVGVQLERVPFDGEGMLWPRRHRAVEIGFADIAPGADDVGDDIKFYHLLAFHSSRSARRFILPFAVVGRASRCR